MVGDHDRPALLERGLREEELGRRDDLAAQMLAHKEPIPGCRSFVVAIDPKDPDAIWITEVWDDEAAWKASLEIPGIKASIERSMPLIAGFGDSIVTEPVGLIP